MAHTTPMPLDTRLRALLAAPLGLLLLTGCGTPPWQEEPSTPATSETGSASESEGEGEGESAPSDESPAPTDAEGEASSPAPSPTVTQVVNDLATGSAVRSLPAAAASLDVTYWSDLPTDAWTPQATKPVSLSMTAVLDDDDVPVYLSRLKVATVVRASDGSQLTGVPDVVDDAVVQPGYTISAPYSYATSFVLPALPEEAASVELTFTYEVLIATTPDDEAYAKQTALDTVTIAIARPSAETAATPSGTESGTETQSPSTD